ncbi:MAG: tetratricopeptide repeat protein, partial [Candidatus Competibacter sp.]
MRRLPCLFVLLALLSPSAGALEDIALAVPAAQYLQAIRENRDAGGQSSAALLQRAEQQARQKNWTAAVADYETAIAAGADPTATWLSLSQLWQARAESNKNDEEARKRQQERTLQSAWNALQAARIPYERARALFRLGELYDRDKEPKKAIAAFREALELEDSPRIAKRYQELVDANAFQIKGVEVESDSATPKVCLKFSDELAKGRQLHYEDYLLIQPAIQPVVSAQGQQLCVEGVSHGQSYTLNARAGIPSATGEKTRVAQDFSVRVEDRKPTLGFRGASYVLPKSGGQQLPLVSVNLDSARLRVLRINDRNLLQQIQSRRISQLLDGSDLQDISQQSGELVWEGTLTLANGERNQETTTAIPVSDILRDPQPGIYIAAAAPTKEDPNGDQERATQWLVVSDIGLSTLRGGDGLHVFARSLATTQPLAKLELRLYARNNSELGKAFTDEKGYV